MEIKRVVYCTKRRPNEFNGYELLVSLILIGILAIVAYPEYQQQSKSEAATEITKSDLKAIKSK